MKAQDYRTIIRNDKYLLVLPLLAITTRLLIFLFIPHTYEDSFITFRYAENLANGYGLVYNIGEKVYGTTTPLFAIILAFFNVLGISCVVSSLVINLISEGITSIIVYKFLKDYSKGIIPVIISLLFVFSPSNISWSIQGMETAFFSAVIALSFYFLYQRRYLPALMFGFLSSMIRIDGLSVAIIIFIFVFIEEKTNAIKLLVLPLLIFITWLVFLYFYFGNILPNSMIAKLILYSGHQSSIFPNIELLLAKFFIMGYYSSSIITLLFILGSIIVFKNRIRLYPMVTWFVIYYLALIISKTTIFGWYLIPPLFAFISVAGIGIIFILQYFQRIFILNKKVLYVLALSGVIFFSTLTLFLKIKQISKEREYELTIRSKIGMYLNENTPDNSTIFLEPIGVIGYYSERYIYDDAALISPEFLEINKLPSAYAAESRYKKIDLVTPDYLVLRDVYLNDFYLNTNLRKDYTEIKHFENQLTLSDTLFKAMTIFERNDK